MPATDDATVRPHASLARPGAARLGSLGGLAAVLALNGGGRLQGQEVLRAVGKPHWQRHSIARNVDQFVTGGSVE
jgi:hypothetical protein